METSQDQYIKEASDYLTLILRANGHLPLHPEYSFDLHAVASAMSRFANEIEELGGIKELRKLNKKHLSKRNK